MKRRGYSLVEMLVVMAILGSFMTLIGLTFATVMHLDNDARRELATNHALAAGEFQLRDDLHAAQEAWLAEGTLKLRPDATHSIVWTSRGAALVRQLWEADQLITEERWPLPPDHAIAWQREENWIELTIARADDGGPQHGGMRLRWMIEIDRFRAGKTP
jgi:prepilin-type N-terminal cleavage/methylation domain-containing protein